MQEFVRVLFDAIEASLAQAGESAEEMNNLYQGEFSSYLQCQTCNFESPTTSTFLDISLPIRNEFGTGVVNSSLEMALENYLKPDLLDGDNQWECTNCKEKRDASKGLKLTKCP